MSVENWFPESRTAIQKAFGEDADIFMRLLAATSPISTIESNVAIAIRAYRHLRWFGEVPRNSFIEVHYICIQKFLKDPNTAGRKVWSLYQNLIGNEQVCPLDRWMKVYFGYDPEKYLSDKLYDELEGRIREEAVKLGISPAQRQVQIWCASRVAGSSRADISYGEIITSRQITAENLLRRLI
jgi:hypothetical protein